GRGVLCFTLSCSRPVTQAVIRGAEVRAALHPPPGNGCAAAGALECSRFADSRTARDAARLLRVVRVSPDEVVRRPFPHVPCHVEEAEPVGWERACGRGPFVTIGGEILPGELALPRVGHVAAVGRGLI